VRVDISGWNVAASVYRRGSGDPRDSRLGSQRYKKKPVVTFISGNDGFLILCRILQQA
jgi:hypothetical protein